MRLTLDPFRLPLISLAGCLNRQRRHVMAANPFEELAVGFAD